MIRTFQIAVLGCAVLLLTGCRAPERNDTLWQQVKIGDLAPAHNGGRAGGRLLKTINFDVYIFEIPAENVGALNDLWQTLYTEPLQFDHDAFIANSFLIGFGQIQMWNEIGELLRVAGGKKAETVTLLIADDQTGELQIARLNSKQTIFYISSDGSMEPVTVGPGKLALRIKAERIPGSRGVCRISAQPVFSPPITSPVPQLAARAKSNEVYFSSVGFELKMSPGDFVLLGPEKYTCRQVTLDSLFFSRAAPSPAVRMFLSIPSGDTQELKPYSGPVVRMFLLVCTRIIY